MTINAHANRAPRREAARVPNSERGDAAGRSGSAGCWAASLASQLFPFWCPLCEKGVHAFGEVGMSSELDRSVELDP